MDDLLDALFARGHAADLALVVLAVEAIVVWRLRQRRARGPRLTDIAPFLAAGAGLLLALRAALVGAPWWCVAAALALSGVAHAVDLARRFRGGPERPVEPHDRGVDA